MPVHAAWNQTGWTDLIVLALKCVVAAALIAHAHHVVATTPDPAATLYGSLRPEDQAAHTVPATLLLLLRTAWAAGGYVLVSSLFGLAGRLLQWAPAYSLYYFANVFGLAVALLACAKPTAWAVGRDSYCLAVDRACLALSPDTTPTCPFTIAGAAGAAAAAAGIAPPVATAGGKALLRGLAPAGENTSPCCYGPDFVHGCSEFLGAAYTQAVIACVLAALMLTQSAISCFYLCCDCDREWDSNPRPPPAPKVTLPRLSLPIAMGNGGKGKTKEEEDEEGGSVAAEGADGNGSRAQQQQQPGGEGGAAPAAADGRNGNGLEEA